LGVVFWFKQRAVFRAEEEFFRLTLAWRRPEKQGPPALSSGGFLVRIS
jgi:hypothetical protein